MFQRETYTERALMPNIMRLFHIERMLMIAELELDGLKTHTTMVKEKCPLYNTPVDMKVRKALSAIRSARDVLRNDMGSKQRTITTVGNIDYDANRDHLWECNPRASFKCAFCK